jgi:myo-inositol-1(or 4)-monophosphatase
MHPMLNTAVKAARRASTIINRASFDIDQVHVTRKEHNDFVTEVDKAAEASIIDMLKTAYPDHAILAEESGASSNLNDDNENVWIIDPLDGTTNFIHGFPQYAVSIALQQRGQITQAVIYDPTRNELFTASKGAGAFLNDKRIRVSKRDKLANGLIGTGFPYSDLSYMDEYMTMFRAMTEKSAGLRRPGSAALDLAYVAAGRLDGFFELRLKPWDLAAGALMISEAGGIVSDFEGESSYLQYGDLVAGSPKVFVQMLNVLTPLYKGHKGRQSLVQG